MKLLIYISFSLCMLAEVFSPVASAQTSSGTETNKTNEETTQVVETTGDSSEVIATGEENVQIFEASNEMTGLNNLLLQLSNLTLINDPGLNGTTAEEAIIDNPQGEIDPGTEETTDAIATPPNAENSTSGDN